MDFNEKLQAILKKDPRFIADDGSILRTKVREAVTNLDSVLLKSLLSEPSLREHFFTSFDNLAVFDKQKFMWVIDSQEFLPDSYTAYRNRIGLSANDHDLLSSSGAVSLVWPYKDCILEGGQDKEDQKRDEIFYNETLAPDEVSQLLAPKAFASAKRYSTKGVEETGDITDDDNLIINGNNLLALSSLLSRYRGKVKCIYIDPPYYFDGGKELDAFQYNSNFKMSTWLTFMTNRLRIAKELLASDGVIWINISEDGMHYLKVACDAIFSADHFVATLPRRTRSGKTDVPFNLSQDFDWLLLYAMGTKSESPVGRRVERKYYETPDYPGRPWRLADLTKQTTAKERPNSFFTMVDPKTGKQYQCSEKRTWALTKETFQKYYDEGAIVFPDDYEFLSGSKRPQARKFKDEDDGKGKLSAVISDFLIKDFLDTLMRNAKNALGNDQIDSLFGRDAFSYAKPETLLKSIIEVSTVEGDLVLDFFGGSGTTAAAAHKMGRRYITTEQMGYADTILAKRLETVINGDTTGISKAVGWQGGGSFVYCELAENGERYLEMLQDAQTGEDVQQILSLITDEGLLRPSVLPDALKDDAEEFKTLSLEEQKCVVAELIDKNRLYVNATDVDDESNGLTEVDRAFTKSFYGLEEA